MTNLTDRGQIIVGQGERYQQEQDDYANRLEDEFPAYVDRLTKMTPGELVFLIDVKRYSMHWKVQAQFMTYYGALKTEILRRLLEKQGT